MHKIHEKKFEESDFSVEYLFDLESEGVEFPIIYGVERTSIGILHYIIPVSYTHLEMNHRE